MAAEIWVVLGILVLSLFLFVLYFSRGKKRPTDYYSLFIIGVMWLFFGIITWNIPILIIGLMFSAVGLANKDKWKKTRVSWSKLTKEERRERLAIITVLAVLVILGLVLFLVSG